MPGASAVRTTADARPVDPGTGVTFVTQEANALREALARPGCPHRLLRVMRRQDRAHESWLALVARARRRGDADLADEIIDLYGFHGRLAGCLEKGFDPSLHPLVERHLRRLLMAELSRLTARAVRGLADQASAAGQPHTRGGRPSVVPCGSRRRDGSPRR